MYERWLILVVVFHSKPKRILNSLSVRYESSFMLFHSYAKGALVLKKHPHSGQ